MRFVSSPTNVEDRQVLLLHGVRMNPLNGFLLAVEPVMQIAWDGAAQQAVDRARYEEFTSNAEERNFSHDVVDRAGQLSYCFDRLCELGIEYNEIRTAMKQGQPNSQGVDLSLVPPAVLAREEKWVQELHVITGFCFYEIKSICDMLKMWGVNLDGCQELRFVLKSRDRFLAHPRLGGIMRLAHRSYGIPFDGGPVEASVSGLNSFDPITRAHYLASLGLDEGTPILDEAQRQANEACVLSPDQNHRLDAAGITRLKAFGLRDANLKSALRELAQVLETQVLPRIQTVFETAKREFGFASF